MAYDETIPEKDNFILDDISQMRDNYTELKSSNGAGIVGYNNANTQIKSSTSQGAINDLNNNLATRLSDILTEGVLTGGDVTENSTPDLNVLIEPLTGFNTNGARINLENQQIVDLSSFLPITTGNEKYVSIYIDVIDLETNTEINVVEGTSAVAGSATKPPVDNTQGVLLADVLLAEGQTSILNVNIKEVRKQKIYLNNIAGQMDYVNVKDLEGNNLGNKINNYLNNNVDYSTIFFPSDIQEDLGEEIILENKSDITFLFNNSYILNTSNLNNMFKIKNSSRIYFYNAKINANENTIFNILGNTQHIAFYNNYFEKMDTGFYFLPNDDTENIDNILFQNNWFGGAVLNNNIFVDKSTKTTSDFYFIRNNFKSGLNNYALKLDGVRKYSFKNNYINAKEGIGGIYFLTSNFKSFSINIEDLGCESNLDDNINVINIQTNTKSFESSFFKNIHYDYGNYSDVKLINGSGTGGIKRCTFGGFSGMEGESYPTGLGGVVNLIDNYKENNIITNGLPKQNISNLININLNTNRNTINNFGLNSGDPNTTGQWNNYGYEGASVADIVNNKLYTYYNGSWK